MRYAKPITEVIKQRYSCRTYLDKPIDEEKRQQLAGFAASRTVGTFGTPTRFQLVAATEEDQTALRGLETYGFISGATGFVLGAVRDAPKNMEDLGYLLEDIVLFATGLGLGTCWLGGTFNRSAFAAKMPLRAGESLPAVIAVGYIADKPSVMESMVRRAAGSDHRLPWEQIAFDAAFGVPLPRDKAGAYAEPLEMLRLAPSASNKQPWRAIRDGAAWHFYLQRSPGYGNARFARLHIADLQRVDMGIAMRHFELTAREAALLGKWVLNEPPLGKPDPLTEYVATWVSETREGA